MDVLLEAVDSDEAEDLRLRFPSESDPIFEQRGVPDEVRCGGGVMLISMGEYRPRISRTA